MADNSSYICNKVESVTAQLYKQIILFFYQQFQYPWVINNSHKPYMDYLLFL